MNNNHTTNKNHRSNAKGSSNRKKKSTTKPAAKIKSSKKSSQKISFNKLLTFIKQNKIKVIIAAVVLLATIFVVFFFAFRKKAPDKKEITNHLNETVSVLTDEYDNEVEYLHLLEDSFSYSVDSIDEDENGNYFATISYSAKDAATSFDEYIAEHGDEAVTSKEQMDQIFSPNCNSNLQLFRKN